MLPSNWKGVTVAQYNEIKEAPEAKEGLLSFMVWALAVLKDQEVEEVESLTPSEIAEQFEKIKFILTEPKPRETVTKIKLGENVLTLKPMQSISFGEAIDAYEILKNDEGQVEKMAALFYRKTALDEFGNVVFEGRNYNYEEREELFKEVNVNDASTALYLFKELNRAIREKYAELFEEPEPEETDDDEDDDEEEETERETVQAARQRAIQEARKKHGWLITALSLTNKDYTKLNDVLKMNFGYVLNILAIEHETKE